MHGILDAVLPVSIERDETAYARQHPSELDPCLQGSTLAHVDGVVHQVGTGLENLVVGAVGRAVVHADDVRTSPRDLLDDRADDRGFVEDGHNERCVVHAAQITPARFWFRPALRTTTPSGRRAGTTVEGMPQSTKQNAPPVQRLRIRYAKRGRLRFTSHRDFGRAFERALVRARIPMAYSSGFNPHPRISYAGAAQTGAASEAEYLEIALAEVVDPEEVRRALEKALPDGLDVVEVVESGRGALADRLEASHWSVVVALPADDVAQAVAAFLATRSLPVERMTKKGLRTFDCRGPVAALSVRPHESGAELDLILRHTVPAVRPPTMRRAGSGSLRACTVDPAATDQVAARATRSCDR